MKIHLKSFPGIYTLNSVTASELEEKMKNEALVFDVRKPGEYEAEHIENVPSTPLDFINEHLAEFPKEDDFYISKSRSIGIYAPSGKMESILFGVKDYY